MTEGGQVFRDVSRERRDLPLLSQRNLYPLWAVLLRTANKVQSLQHATATADGKRDRPIEKRDSLSGQPCSLWISDFARCLIALTPHYFLQLRMICKKLCSSHWSPNRLCLVLASFPRRNGSCNCWFCRGGDHSVGRKWSCTYNTWSVRSSCTCQFHSELFLRCSAHHPPGKFEEFQDSSCQRHLIVVIGVCQADRGDRAKLQSSVLFLLPHRQRRVEWQARLPRRSPDGGQL